ncbi:murein hydrolase activator EnvC family protein [Streptomyces sp. NPDC059788]|uniref:murein hydrolase activator EnvC family protein n=1 Tax=Streptomyces sp. NPDC059788 TaxID=3346948 RepID=UPI003667D1D8
MRLRTITETVRAVITWHPKRSASTSNTRRPRVPSALVQRALRIAAEPINHADRTGLGPSCTSRRSGTLYAWQAGGGGRGGALPAVVRVLALCAVSASLAVLLAGAAATAAGLTGAAPSPPETPTAWPKGPPPPDHPFTARAAHLSPATNGERAWPVAGPTGARPTIARGWEPPPAPWAPGHRGVDLAASPGATVGAAAPGRVLFAGMVAGRGVLSIEVAESGRPPLRTTYEPVDPTVRKGDHVTAGQPVATLASGPFHGSSPCLHWGLLRDRIYLDPLSLLPASILHPGPSRLLPVIGVPEPGEDPAHHRAPPAPRHSTRTRGTNSGTGTDRVHTKTPAHPAHLYRQVAHAEEGRTNPLLSLLRRPKPWRPQPP